MSPALTHSHTQTHTQTHTHTHRYYAVLLLVSLAYSVFAANMFVSQMAFFARVSDPAIGGTYVASTFFYTLKKNVSHSVQQSFLLSGVHSEVLSLLLSFSDRRHRRLCYLCNIHVPMPSVSLSVLLAVLLYVLRLTGSIHDTMLHRRYLHCGPRDNVPGQAWFVFVRGYRQRDLLRVGSGLFED